ncbi:hypothetical protein SAMN04489761_3364 [Tenacibaculum sp. MAR_2009_124]|uniref:hypothetical protein n=1 Tax=Tenacibaculum sp. MAR_2009_124 TaxID=1250059 RepID=UPI000895332F|nr:hypothetical protein [Tenacibaculum sp. MAR_2009_124]SEC63937.1 hypothetical protein SAMN04489761_3364 [Tenacibaculum sp. MAR_2009_124]
MSRFYKACLKEQYQNEQTIELINTAFINEFQAPKVKVDNFEIPIINNIQYLQWELDNMKENPLTAPKHWSVAKLRKATWKTLSDELQFKGYGYGEV